MTNPTARRSLQLLLAIAIVGCVVSCGGSPRFTAEDPHWQDDDRREIDEPGFIERSIAWDAFRSSTFEQIDQTLDLERGLRKLSGDREEAWNVNSLDEVPNSTWWTNRHFFEPLSAEELKTGNYMSGGPDTTGRWRVFRPKVGGVTPGFWIKDKEGKEFILKFDPPGYPELATSSAIIAGRFFHAFGYNVPEETISRFHPDSLEIGEGVTYKNEEGIRVPFTRETLDDILSRVHVQPDGWVRCLASTKLENVKGPFAFSGRRNDDPNDWCPREHRRELRALRLFSAFLNHWDIKDDNTMDIFVGDEGRGYLKHYLLDFGTVLGSGGYRVQNPRRGYTNFFDINHFFFSFATLGAKVWPWERAKPVKFREVGYLEAEMFKPQDWKPGYPMRAFENMTMRDAYWAAKTIMSFTHDDLEAVVEAGRISNPEAASHLVRILKARQDRIGSYYFGKMSSLDNFKVSRVGETIRLYFEDLAGKHGLAEQSQTTASLTGAPVSESVAARRVADGFELDIDQQMLDIESPAAITLRTVGDEGRTSKVVVWLRRSGSAGETPGYEIVGIER